MKQIKNKQSNKLNKITIIIALIFLVGFVVTVLPGKVSAESYATCALDVYINNSTGNVTMHATANEHHPGTDNSNTQLYVYDDLGAGDWDSGDNSAVVGYTKHFPDGTYTAYSEVESCIYPGNSCSTCSKTKVFTVKTTPIIQEPCKINSFTADDYNPPYNTSTMLKFSFNYSFPWTITNVQGPTIPYLTSGNGLGEATATGNLTLQHIYRLTCKDPQGDVTRDLTVDPGSSGTIYQYRCGGGGSCIYVGSDGTGDTNDPTCNNSCSTPPPPPPPPPPSTCSEDASVSVIQPLPPTMNPGQTYSFTMRAKNTGSSWWYHGSVYQFIKTSGNMAITPSMGWLPNRIIGGDYVDWTFNVTAPSTPGNYFVQMQMLHTTYATGDYLDSDGNVCAPPPTSDTYFGNVGMVSSVVSVPNYTLTINKVGTGLGTVGGAGSYPDNTLVGANYTLNPDSTFGGWSGDCDSSGHVTMNSNKTCTASFNLNPPSTPTGFFVAPSSCGNNWLNLRWSVSRGATSYQVYREGTLITLAGYSCDAFSCSGSDTGLILGSPYSYKVTASNVGGTSAPALASGTVAPYCPINGGWGGWSPASCPVACGLPASTLNRFCNNPVPQYGGTQCTADGSLAVQSCPKTSDCACLAPASQTRSVSCGPAFYSGNITEIQYKGSSPACAWGSWSELSRDCVNFILCSDGSPAPGNNPANCGASTAVPTVISPTATNITSTGATLGATVISAGIPATLSTRGTCYATTLNPTFANGANCLSEGSITTGIFTQTRTGLLPNTTYHFSGYATNATGIGYSVDRSFITSSGPLTYTFTVTVNNPIGGFVKSTDNIINCGSNCSHLYNSGDTVNLQATPSSSYWEFSGWSGGCSGALPTCSINVNGNVTVTATFKPRLFDYREF